MLVTKEFTFDSAHFLTKYHGKCERLHGHTYRLRVTVEGPVQDEGMVVDFVELKHLVKEKVVDVYDHQSLNDFFENPTAELIVQKVWDELEKPISKMAEGAKLYELVLWETAESFVTYRGE